MARARRCLGRLLSGLALGCALGLGASPVHADEPVPPTNVDPDLYPPSGTQLPLAAVALGTSAVWYGAAVGFSYLWPDAPGAEDLRIPVAGPWMALADTGCADDDPDCSIFIVIIRAVLTSIDAVGQTGGVLVAAEAAFLPTQEPVAAPRKRPLPRLRRDEGLRLTPTPMVSGRDGIGIGVLGQF